MLTVSPGLLNRISGGCHVSYVKQSNFSHPHSAFSSGMADAATLGEEIRWGLGQAVNPANLESFLTVGDNCPTTHACGPCLMNIDPMIPGAFRHCALLQLHADIL